MSSASTKITSASDFKNPFVAKLDELDRQSDALQSEGTHQSCASLRYNYTIRKHELDNQRDELAAKLANAEIEFKREQELKKQEEGSIVCQIQLQQGPQGGYHYPGPSVPGADMALSGFPPAYHPASSTPPNNPALSHPESFPPSQSSGMTRKFFLFSNQTLSLYHWSVVCHHVFLFYVDSNITMYHPPCLMLTMYLSILSSTKRSCIKFM